GVEVGLRLSPRSTGLLFPLLLHSPSIRTAVELLVRYQMLISQNGLFRVNDISSSNSLLCTYVPARSSVAVHPQHSLSVITAALKTLGSISSRRIRASLCLPAGLDAEGISALLQCPVQAAGELYILELACEGMDEPIAGRDEHLYQLTLGYAEGLLRAQNAGQGFLDQIKHHMDGEQLVQTDIDTVAAAVGVTRRTLRRHLDDQVTSFRKLKEGLLKERVLELLLARHQPNAISMVTAAALTKSSTACSRRGYWSCCQPDTSPSTTYPKPSVMPISAPSTVPSRPGSVLPPDTSRARSAVDPASSRRPWMSQCPFSTSLSPVDKRPSTLTITGGRRLWRNPLWISRLVMHSMRRGIHTACAQAEHRVMLLATDCIIWGFQVYPQKSG